MSTATATPAASTAAAPAVVPPASTEKKVITPSIAAQIRRRAQGLPELTAEQLAEQKAKADADKSAADAKAAADKKAADDAAAAAALAAGGTPPVVPPVVEKVKKVKAGPALPDAPAPAGGQPTVEEQVRAALAKDKENASSASTPPTLSPEVEREVELARFAAKKSPDKYAGMDQKIIGFYQSRDQMLATKAKELGGQQSGEFKEYIESDEFKEWVRTNRPAYQRGDVAKLQEDMIADRARAEARAEMAPELKALARQTAELQHAPEINALTNQALKIIITDNSAEKDPALAGFNADPIKFGEQYPEEAQLIASEAAEAIDQIKEVYRIDRDLVDFDVTKPTEVQREIRTFAQNLNERLRAANPTGLEMQDGKILIDAATYQKRGLDRDPRYRTLNAHEIAGAIAAERSDKLRAKLARRRDGVSKSIYAPRATTPPVVPPVQATPAADEPASPEAVSTRAGSARGKPLTTAIQAAKNKHLNGK